MNTPAQHFAYTTTERAAEVVTNGTSMFTPEQLAGWYAFDAAREAGYGYDDANLTAHLEFIADLGAVFDQAGAIAAAHEFAAIYASLD